MEEEGRKNFAKNCEGLMQILASPDSVSTYRKEYFHALVTKVETFLHPEVQPNRACIFREPGLPS